MSRRYASEAEAVAAAAEVLVEARRQMARMSPRQQAEAAHRAGGPGVDELEDRIRARRGLPPLQRLQKEVSD